MAIVRLQPVHIDLIRQEAEAAWPNECCGLLVGTGNRTEGIVVADVVPSPNLAASDRSDRFEVDPEVRFKTMRDCEAQDLEIVGHYHSHPEHPPEPSAVDLEMAYEPELVWLIAGLTDGKVNALNAFRLNDDASAFEAIGAAPGEHNSFDIRYADPA